MNGDTTQADLFVLFKEFGYIDYVRFCFYLSRDDVISTVIFSKGAKSSASNRTPFVYRAKSSLLRCFMIFRSDHAILFTSKMFYTSIFIHFFQVRLCRDRDTGRSRGFAFIYYNTIDGAERAKRRLDDTLIGGSRVRIDFAAVLKDNRFVG